MFVTIGGFGGTQFALSYGVPVVITGTMEDKPETAARVAWYGCGINLRTMRPSAERIRLAVRHLAEDDTYRSRARTLADQIARHDALPTIESELEAVVATGGGSWH